MTLSLRALTGPAVAAVLDDVARLRIAVFREWPYLYDGDLDYERRYLATYPHSPGALVVVAMDGARVVGASTATLMEDHAAEFAAPFAGTGLELGQIYYGAESVLLPEYRGQGVGGRFFDMREQFARDLGRSHLAFCSVIRPPDHPLRPKGARDNAGFWTRRGYAAMPGVVARFSWKDLGHADQTEKPLQFWIRRL